MRVKLEEKGIEIGEDEFNQKFDAALQEIQSAERESAKPSANR